MNDRPVVHTPGELLVAAREGAGLSLDDVAERTKIPIAVLRALELDEYHKVSGPLYVNSFLRTYAADIGLEPALVLEAYARFSGEVIGVSGEAESANVWTEEEVQIRRVGLPWGLIGAAAGAVLVLVLLGLWIFGGGDDGTDATADSAEPVARRESLLSDELPAVTGDTLPAEFDSMAGATTAGTDDSPTSAPESAAVAEESNVPPAARSESLPAADAGVPALMFGDGARWPLVLRVVTAVPVGVQVVRDAEREPHTVDWPAASDAASGLPTVGVRHGEPYRVREGWAVYWGARDQFSLRLDSTEGVVVTLNGRRRDLSGLKPGQEIILFLSDAGR